MEPRAKDGRMGKYASILRRAMWNPGQEILYNFAEVQPYIED